MIAYQRKNILDLHKKPPFVPELPVFLHKAGESVERGDGSSFCETQQNEEPSPRSTKNRPLSFPILYILSIPNA